MTTSPIATREYTCPTCGSWIGFTKHADGMCDLCRPVVVTPEAVSVPVVVPHTSRFQAGDIVVDDKGRSGTVRDIDALNVLLVEQERGSFWIPASRVRLSRRPAPVVEEATMPEQTMTYNSPSARRFSSFLDACKGTDLWTADGGWADQTVVTEEDATMPEQTIPTSTIVETATGYYDVTAPDGRVYTFGNRVDAKAMAAYQDAMARNVDPLSHLETLHAAYLAASRVLRDDPTESNNIAYDTARNDWEQALRIYEDDNR